MGHAQEGAASGPISRILSRGGAGGHDRKLEVRGVKRCLFKFRAGKEIRDEIQTRSNKD